MKPDMDKIIAITIGFAILSWIVLWLLTGGNA